VFAIYLYKHPGLFVFIAAAVMQNQVIPSIQQMTALVGVLCLTIAVLTSTPYGVEEEKP